ncbi:MAG: adenylate/guanylate cyclase domain-containing protein [Rhodospirillales bacterium]|jgi:adenylate cyclase|nr:adenylate/guanylate cyclase domain-containing protein [Rhodospirillales bacterium]MDP6773779.1 adenylate/guanylate cyclase domain-containing protein [Rhodospirillales bacterium]
MWKLISRFVFGERPDSHLAERVHASIAAQQTQSEILIGWVQLALVVVFGTLYAVAPKTSMNADFRPVPWVLALYLVFTVLRLGFSYRGLLPRWVLMVSVAADTSLLMVLIWSFHIQYMQPASFYLKAPTMLYVFIFIALRALRFEPVFIVAAGIMAAVGWLCLMLYVLFAVPGDAMITRDYVEYMTSNSILVGAEVDKILSILFVTFVLAVALVRARRLLIRSVADSTAAHDLSRFVSREIADRITTADNQIQPGDGEVKVATVMFTDIEGFSTISERIGPDKLVSALNEYFAALSEVIEGHGGVITQFEGDAMLVGFNTVKPDDDHAADAVRTAIGIQRVVNSRTFGDGEKMKTRCGINTGQMVAGAVGSQDRLIFTVHGDEVNVAARLEQLNKQYGTYILASERAVGEAGGDFPFEEVGEVTVRGRTAPTRVFAIRHIPDSPRS